MSTSLLSIGDLQAAIEDKAILKGLTLEIQPGEIHAIMGPNGSGKSTLSATLMGNPAYRVTGGSASLCGEELFAMKPETRAAKGLFLAFQYPQAIPGVTLVSFLRAAVNAQRKARDPKAQPISLLEFRKTMRAAMQELHLPAEFMNRSVNDGFSGGEKKKAEILQMMLLNPKMILLDETDSGLDIDALKIICENIEKIRSPKCSMLLITHYKRILNYITPDFVHVMMDGKIVKSGGPELAEQLEESGYDLIRKAEPLRTEPNPLSHVSTKIR